MGTNDKEYTNQRLHTVTEVYTCTKRIEGDVVRQEDKAFSAMHAYTPL